MKTYYYTADAGSVMLGNNTFKAHYSNGYGDGYFEIYIAEAGEVKTPEADGWHFVDVVEGSFAVYDYDCSDAEILTTLSGRYLIYNKCGDILLAKSEF